MGERYGEIEYRLVQFYNDSVVQAVTFAYLIYWKVSCKTRNTFRRTRSLSNATFLFLITWRSSSSKSAAVCKISSKSDDFYRAMRMHSRLAVARCPSVCLSHAGIVSKRLYISSKFFHRRVATSPAILVFPHQTGWQYSDGNPLTGASNARGYEKNQDFRQISHSISEMMRDGAIVIVEGE